jgi:hypothetical protein
MRARERQPSRWRHQAAVGGMRAAVGGMRAAVGGMQATVGVMEREDFIYSRRQKTSHH